LKFDIKMIENPIDILENLFKSDVY